MGRLGFGFDWKTETLPTIGSCHKTNVENFSQYSWEILLKNYIEKDKKKTKKKLYNTVIWQGDINNQLQA